MQSLKIILLCMASTILYGVCHDQVTARVCVEYFTVGHVPPFHTESPTVLAFYFGTMATWWVGLVFGVLAALVSRAGPWPTLNAAHLIQPIACVVIVMAVASILAGITGYQVAAGSGFVLPEPLGNRVPKDHHHSFFADSLAHLAAYAVGVLGGLILCVGVLVQRRRMGRAAALAIGGTARTDLLGEHWVVAACRWTGRTVSVPLLGLLVVLTLGDGVPNPLAASPRVRLFIAVALVMLVGLILAWRWEGVGSLLILGALVLFSAADEPFLINIVIAPWLVTGLSYLACSVGVRQCTSRQALHSKARRRTAHAGIRVHTRR